MQKLERLKKEARPLRDWLNQPPQERKSAKGQVRLSNRTDHESWPPLKGGSRATLEKHRVIVAAQAHGMGSEQELLVPVGEATAG